MQILWAQEHTVIKLTFKIVLYNRHNTLRLISLYKLFMYIYIYNILRCFFVLFCRFSDPVRIYLLNEKIGQEIIPKFTFCVLQKQVWQIQNNMKVTK